MGMRLLPYIDLQSITLHGDGKLFLVTSEKGIASPEDQNFWCEG